MPKSESGSDNKTHQSRFALRRFRFSLAWMLICVTAIAVALGLSMVIGSFVLRIFELSVAVVQVAGGAVVCALGWKLLNDDSKPSDGFNDPQQASIVALARSF